MSKTNTVEKFIKQMKNNCFKEKKYDFQELYKTYCEWYKEKYDIEKPTSPNGFGMSLKVLNLSLSDGQYVFQELSEREVEKIKRDQVEELDKLNKDLYDKLIGEEENRQRQEDKRRQDEDTRRLEEDTRRRDEDVRRLKINESIKEDQLKLSAKITTEIDNDTRFWKRECESHLYNEKVKLEEETRRKREKEEQKALKKHKKESKSIV